MSGNRAISNVMFHDKATIPSDGITYTMTADASTMNIAFVGTGTFMAVVEGKILQQGNFNEIMVVDLQTYDMTTQPNAFHTYQCDIIGWSYIRIRLTSVSNEVTVYGKLVG